MFTKWEQRPEPCNVIAQVCSHHKMQMLPLESLKRLEPGRRSALTATELLSVLFFKFTTIHGQQVTDILSKWRKQKRNSNRSHFKEARTVVCWEDRWVATCCSTGQLSQSSCCTEWQHRRRHWPSTRHLTTQPYRNDVRTFPPALILCWDYLLCLPHDHLLQTVVYVSPFLLLLTS